MAEKKNCEHCGKPGGRVVIDPYQKEVFGEEVKMRLHENCLQSRIEGI